MSSPDLNPENPPPAGLPVLGRRGPPVSALAVCGLVLAVIPCCPPLGLIGAFLGVLALRRIRVAADGGRALGGRRLALAAVVLGAASAMVWSVLLDRYMENVAESHNEAMTGQITRFIEAAAGGDAEAALALWAPDDAARPLEGEVLEFGRAVRERYGGLDRIAVMSVSSRGSLFAPRMEVSGTFRFEREAPFGNALIDIRASLGFGAPLFHLAALTIEDRVRGDLTLGAAPGPAEALPDDAPAPAP